MRDSIPLQWFLACRRCDLVERLYPEAVDTPPLGELREFLTGHAGHPIEVLRRLGDAIVSDRPLWDPLAVTYVAVSNGREEFLVRAARCSIEEPINRRLLPGYLQSNAVDVALDADAFLRAVDAYFFPHTMPVTKTKRLLDLADAQLARFDAHSLEILYDSVDDPTVSFASLPAEVYATVDARCADVLDGYDLARMRAFLSENRRPDGALVVRITRSWDLHLRQPDACRLSG